jgi:quinol monooxygenase YgiN
MENTPQTSVHLKVTVDPARADTFLEALRPVFEAVVADPRNTFFEVYRDEQNPGVFKLVENWSATVEYMTEVRGQM